MSETLLLILATAALLAIAVVVSYWLNRPDNRTREDTLNQAVTQKVLVLEGQMDVLKGQLARQQPAEAESVYRSMIDASGDAILLVNRHGIIELASKGAETMFSWPSGSMTGLPLNELVPERFREQHHGHKAGYFASPHPRPMGVGLELRGRRSDGTEFPVEIGLSPYRRIGEEMKVVAVVRDMSQRLAKEA